MKQEPETSPPASGPIHLAVRFAGLALLLQLLGLVFCAKHVAPLYEPGMELVAPLFPDDWFVTGNILFGLFLLLLAAAVYAAACGVVAAGVLALVHRVRGIGPGDP